MTEEEKKAIEYLKDYIKSDLNYFTIDFNNNLRISMNLIKKLQKEIEDSIPKDKIRDRLLVVKDLKSKIDLSKKETPVEFYVLDYVNNLLEELLEEE